MSVGFSQEHDNRTSGYLLEQLATSLAVLDAELRFARANAAFCELFEAGSPKLRDVPLSEFGKAGQVIGPIADRARSQQTAVASRGERIETASGHQFSADIICTAIAGGVLLEVHRVAPEGAVAPPSRLSESLRGLAHE